VEIRRLRTGEGAAIRELRLRVLQDASSTRRRTGAGSGAARLELSVSDRAAEAVQLYAARGFQPTGEIRPLPSDTSATEIALALPL
jgi:hypothetical protein